MSLIIIGAGGHAKVVIAAAKAADVAIDGVYDDRRDLWGTRLMGFPVVGSLALLEQLAGHAAVIAIGDNRMRSRIAQTYPMQWQSIVHPRAYVDPTATVGSGAVICAGAIIQPEAHIDSHVIVNTGATVDHDCHIEPFAHICPGCHLAGNVRVGEGAMLGVGSSVVPGVTIGPWAVLGAGGVAIRDIPANATAVGCPARVLPH